MSSIALPALSYAHSHAFQRAMRGMAQRRPPIDPASPHASREDFWSWRGAMYGAASALDPESIYSISRVAFRELHDAGVRTVGEFHYIHHQPDGTPYDDRTIMSDAVVRAARDEGLRVALLRVAYHRAGPGRVAEPGQRRFCDPSVDVVLRDVEELAKKYANDPNVRVGVAPHSVRAVPPEWIRELAEWSRARDLPFHMHVAEQPREIEECIAETGRRPVELLAELGALSHRFVAVHATHLAPHEAKLLGGAGAIACVCATTEADLGDGLPDLLALRNAGAKLCTGIDSYVVVDPIADLRALETGQRLRTGERVTFDPRAFGQARSPAEQLWFEGSVQGAIACGFDAQAPELTMPTLPTMPTLEVSRDQPFFELVPEELVLDAIVFSGTPAILRKN